MFINPKIFKKLLKKSYEGQGIYLANHEGTVIIAGNSWVINVDENRIPKEIKAMIIGFTDFLPRTGDEPCLISENGMQMEIFNDALLLTEKWKSQKNKIIKTPVYVDLKYIGMTRVYQGAYDVFVNEILDNMVSIKEVEEHEEIPQGPFIVERSIMYGNDVMILQYYTIKVLDDDGEAGDILAALERIKFGGNDE